ncbi:MAG TPA: hypothetical protein VGB18_02545 [Candidatus Thermoplasmatota archaeon]
METELTPAEKQAMKSLLARGRNATQAIAAQGPKLAAAHGGKWVAFRDGIVVASASSTATLERKLADMGDAAASVVIRLIPKKTDRFVLSA